MDEQENRELSQKILAGIQETREILKQNRRWSTLPLDWLILWKLRKTERELQEELLASEYTYTYKPSLFSRVFHRPRL